MKKVYTILLAILLPFSASPQNTKKDFERMNQAYQKLRWCYYGVQGDQEIVYENKPTMLAEAKQEINAQKGKYNATYPIFFNLCEHLRFSIEEDPYNACNQLHYALKAYRNLSKKVDAALIHKSYKNNFGIDSTVIKEYFKSDYSRHLGISLEVPCPSRIKEPIKPKQEQPIINEKPVNKTSIKEEEVRTAPTDQLKGKKEAHYPTTGINVHTEDGVELIVAPNHSSFKTSDQEVEDSNPLDVLRKMLSRGLITETLEITEIIEGDGRLIPGQKGVPYEVKMKNARTKEVIHFDGGLYYILDQQDEKVDRFFPPYQKSMTDFTRLVLWIMDDYGNSAYKIFVQGSADVVTFTPKPFQEKYDDQEWFHEFPYLIMDRKQNTVRTGQFFADTLYDNNLLPDLRAAFIRYHLLKTDRLSGRKDKVTVVKGNVKPYRDHEKRNCSVIIYIDWERAQQNR